MLGEGAVRRQVNLALLGCGAVTRGFHLPAAMAVPEVHIAALVDSDLKRAETLRRSFGLDCKLTADYKPILAHVDGVVNALPNHLHAAATLEALEAGRHVLCEKPLAITTDSARLCCQAAEEKGLTLAVGMQMRFHPNQDLLRLVMDEGRLGDIMRYDWEYGTAWQWNTQSGFYFSRSQAGGGILIDFGHHLLDRSINWFGPVEQFEYRDDNWGGGIEANVSLDLTHNGRFGRVNGNLRLSRTYRLKNRLLVKGTQADAEVLLADVDSVVLHGRVGEQKVKMTMCAADLPVSEPIRCYVDQLRNFVESIRGAQKPRVDGWQALETLKLIEDCYAKAKRIPEPWAELEDATTGLHTCTGGKNPYS
jgi:predicted dehydrogenase